MSYSCNNITFVAIIGERKICLGKDRPILFGWLCKCLPVMVIPPSVTRHRERRRSVIFSTEPIDRFTSEDSNGLNGWCKDDDCVKVFFEKTTVTFTFPASLRIEEMILIHDKLYYFATSVLTKGDLDCCYRPTLLYLYALKVARIIDSSISLCATVGISLTRLSCERYSYLDTL